jgi:hypothetical protein
MTRNFYGARRVKDIGADGEQDAVRRLMHGVIMHGEQYRDPERSGEPTTYYGATSGIARAIKALDGSGMRVGVVGLGTGTLAAFGRPGDVYRFYEINPQVVDVANREFTFLGDSGIADKKAFVDQLRNTGHEDFASRISSMFGVSSRITKPSRRGIFSRFRKNDKK